MNRYKYILCVVLAGLLAFPAASRAQKAKKAKAPQITYSGRVTDDTGGPVANAAVMSGEGAVIVHTDDNGEFSILSEEGGVLLIEAAGYEDYLLGTGAGIPESIVLKEYEIFNSEADMLERIDLGYISRRDLTGAVGSVDMDKLRRYPDLVITNGLQGRVAGLVVRQTTNGLGNNLPDLFVRGQHTTGANQAIVIVDGIERPFEDLIPEEIESIQVLKDPVAKITYGPAAANGVIMVTTKRGEAYKRVIRTTVEAGASPTLRAPEFMGAYDYVRYYNQARGNDGLADFYSPAQVEGYRNSTGMNDLLYPDANLRKELTRNFTTYRKAALEFFGGNRNVLYSMTVGYTGGTGLEKIGKKQDLNRFSIRGNLDIRLNDFISVTAGLAGRLEVKDWGAASSAVMFPTLSQIKPNEYPVFIDEQWIDSEDVRDDGIPYFGASNRYTSNLYGDMIYGGNESERYGSSQSDLGVNFDFNRFVKGLQASAHVTFDNYNYTKQTFTRQYPTWSRNTYLDANGDEQVSVYKRLLLNNPPDPVINSATVKRSLGWRFNVAYERSIEKHRLDAVASIRYYKDEQKGNVQDDVELNTTFRLNYSYDDRFFAEGTAAIMASNRFSEYNRYFVSPAVGVGWVISNEDFMASSRNINFLKLKASYGILGFSDNTPHSLYQTAWYQNGTTPFNEINNTPAYIVALIRNGVAGLKWESSREINVGVEGMFFNSRLSAEVNYFDEMRRNIIGTKTVDFASTLGNYTVPSNMGKVHNRGLELALSWTDEPFEDFRYSIGVNFLYSKNKVLEGNESPRIESYRKSIGRPTSTIFGLGDMGLFGKDTPLTGHPIQTWGPYIDGDIAYADLNGDGVVDGRDVMGLGQNFPTTVWGVDVDLNWRGIGLYALFTAETGVGKIMSNAYFWNRGENNYSMLAPDSYHATENPGGVWPRLTTTNGDNNFQTSSFWYRKTDFLRLKNLELSYTFDTKRSVALKRMKVFVRGTNLFVVSPFKDLDPETPNSGVTNYPAYSTCTAGVTFTF